MKRNQLFMLSLLVLGAQGLSIGSSLAGLTAAGALVETSPYAMDGEGPFVLPALESYAERHVRLGAGGEAWGVSRRDAVLHDPFPSGISRIDD